MGRADYAVRTSTLRSGSGLLGGTSAEQSGRPFPVIHALFPFFPSLFWDAHVCSDPARADSFSQWYSHSLIKKKKSLREVGGVTSRLLWPASVDRADRTDCLHRLLWIQTVLQTAALADTYLFPKTLTFALCLNLFHLAWTIEHYHIQLCGGQWTHRQASHLLRVCPCVCDSPLLIRCLYVSQMCHFAVCVKGFTHLLDVCLSGCGEGVCWVLVDRMWGEQLLPQGWRGRNVRNPMGNPLWPFECSSVSQSILL